MATAVIIWMLWCTSTVIVPRECSLSLNTLSRWHLKHTEWIWMLDCALHLQTVGVGARKLSSDWGTNHSLCLNWGTNVKKKRVAGGKSPLPVSLYSMHQASLPAVHLFSLCWSRQNVSVWSCTLRMYAVRTQQALQYRFLLFLFALRTVHVLCLIKLGECNFVFHIVNYGTNAAGDWFLWRTYTKRMQLRWLKVLWKKPNGNWGTVTFFPHFSTQAMNLNH